MTRLVATAILGAFVGVATLAANDLLGEVWRTLHPAPEATAEAIPEGVS